MYVIDKVVRKKLLKDKKKRAQSAMSPGSDLHFILSPENTAEKQSRNQYENVAPVNTRYKHANLSAKTPGKSQPEVGDPQFLNYDEWYETKEVYKKYRDKLVKCIKEDMKSNLLNKVSQDIEEYEAKLAKIMKQEYNRSLGKNSMSKAKSKEAKKKKQSKLIPYKIPSKSLKFGHIMPHTTPSSQI